MPEAQYTEDINSFRDGDIETLVPNTISGTIWIGIDGGCKAFSTGEETKQTWLKPQEFLFPDIKAVEIEGQTLIKS